jgi:hypothetical protein
MELADFERPIHNAIRSTYVTARAAGRHMIRQGSGGILMFADGVDPIREYNGHPRPDVARLSTTSGRLEGRLLAVVRELADCRDIAWHPR